MAAPTTVPEVADKETSVKWCESYGYHGHCKKGSLCVESHDIELILDGLMKRAVKRKRDAVKAKADSITTIVSRLEIDGAEPATDASLAVPHSAYYDACITAFVFCRYVVQNERRIESDHRGDDNNNGNSSSSSEDEVDGGEKMHAPWQTIWRNRIYVIGKHIPLLVYKSQFSKTSKHHQAKLPLVLGNSALH
jgi:hypothetical protein